MDRKALNKIKERIEMLERSVYTNSDNMDMLLFRLVLNELQELSRDLGEILDGE